MDDSALVSAQSADAGATTAEGVLFNLTYSSELKYAVTLEFVISFLLAAFIVLLFSKERFNLNSLKGDSDDLIYKLSARHLAARSIYVRALLLYVGVLLLLLGAVSFLGPRVLLGSSADLKIIEAAPASLPLFAALVLVGVLPNVQWLQDVELRIRRFAHRTALIPKATEELARQLTAADFDFSAYEHPLQIGAKAMRGVEPTDFSSADDSLEYRWAQASCLLYKLGRIKAGFDQDNFDSELLARSAPELERLVLVRRSLEDEVRKYRESKNSEGGDSEIESINDQIAWIIRQCCILIACAAQTGAKSPDELVSILKSFGFAVSTPSSRHDRGDFVLLAALIPPGVAFIFTFFAGLVSDLGLWNGSVLFPKLGFMTFFEPMRMIFIFSLPLLAADYVRLYLKRSHVTSDRRDYSAYIWAGVSSVAIGYLGSVLWLGYGQGFTFGKLQIALPSIFVSAAAGILYAYNLDSVQMAKGSMTQRLENVRYLFGVSVQIIAFMFVGFVSSVLGNKIVVSRMVASNWPQEQIDAYANAYDYTIFITFVIGVIGGALAAYVLFSKQSKSRRALIERADESLPGDWFSKGRVAADTRLRSFEW